MADNPFADPAEAPVSFAGSEGGKHAPRGRPAPFPLSAPSPPPLQPPWGKAKRLPSLWG